jgi:hypothetical protein
MSIWRTRSGLRSHSAIGICLAALCSLIYSGVASARQAKAGSIHIERGPDAPKRLQAANVLLYEELVVYRDSHPTVFDRRHPFFSRLLTDPAYMNRIVDRWKAHEARFEYWHPYLWRILDGYEHRLDSQPPPHHEPPPKRGGGHHGSGGGSGGGGHHGSGGGIDPSATPEPSSIVVFLSGLVVASGGAALRKLRRR